MNSLQFSIHIPSFDILGKYVLSEIDSAKERIVKLEISDDQKSYELTNAIKEIQELRIQDHMKSNLISTILQSQTEILFALNLTKVKLDKQESEHNATKLELEQLKLNFKKMINDTGPMICQKKGSKYQWIDEANRCIYYDENVSTYSAAKARCKKTFNGKGRMYEPKTFAESLQIYKFGLNTYWQVNVFDIVMVYRKFAL